MERNLIIKAIGLCLAVLVFLLGESVFISQDSLLGRLNDNAGYTQTNRQSKISLPVENQDTGVIPAEAVAGIG